MNQGFCITYFHLLKLFSKKLNINKGNQPKVKKRIMNQIDHLSLTYQNQNIKYYQAIKNMNFMPQMKLRGNEYLLLFSSKEVLQQSSNLQFVIFNNKVYQIVVIFKILY